ncbi:hypothetical protein [Streptomyces hypolithicus]
MTAFAKDPALRPPPWQPLTFKGWTATAVLHHDRVEFRRSRLAKLGGNTDATVAFSDVSRIVGKPPSLLVNGWVFLAMEADPDQLRSWADRPAKQIAGNPHAIMFTLARATSYAAFLASAEATWRATGGRAARP